MELVVIGAGPAYTDRRGAASASHLVCAEGAALLLDLGQGAFPNLASTIEPSTLTAVVVSHLHPDHFIDLMPLRHYLKWQFTPPRHVAVFGPAGLADRLDAVNGQPGFAAASLEIARLEEGARRIGPFTVEARRVHHSGESYGLRVSVAPDPAVATDPAVAPDPAVVARVSPGLVYSGDCGDADDLIPLIRPGDMLLCEASFGAGVVPPGAAHLTAAEAGRVATAGGAARLLLTHIQMGYSRADTLAAAQSTFAGPIQLVTEGDRFEI